VSVRLGKRGRGVEVEAEVVCVGREGGGVTADTAS